MTAAPLPTQTRVVGDAASRSRGRTRPAARPPWPPGARRAGAAISRRFEDDAAEADPGRGDPVDLDVERVRRRPARDSGRTTSDGRPARPWSRGSLLADQAGRGQVGGERADRAAVEPERWRSSSAREVGPRTCTYRSRVPRLCRRISSWLGPARMRVRQRTDAVTVAGARRPRRDSASTRGGEQQHDAGDDVLEPALEPSRPMPLSMIGDHGAAEDRVEDPALAAEQAGAADDGGADGVEQHVAAAGVRVDRVGPGGGDDAADRRPCVEQMTNALIRIRSAVDAGPAGRLAVAADRVDVPAVRRCGRSTKVSTTSSTTTIGTTIGTPLSEVTQRVAAALQVEHVDGDARRPRASAADPERDRPTIGSAIEAAAPARLHARRSWTAA